MEARPDTEARTDIARQDGGDLAGFVRGQPERLDQAGTRGQFIEAEHLARYHWAAALAAGRRVLDAACGTAYGSVVLAEAGAAEVVGVDLAGDVLDRIRPRMPGRVTLEQADLHDLPFENDRFDLVVCFETIEHVTDQSTALDEISRVLAPGGFLAISSPNPAVYLADNPHHVHELTPAEMREVLQGRFREVRLLGQHPWAASAVLDAKALAGGVDVEVESARLRKALSLSLEEATYSVALASDQPLPDLPPLALLTAQVEMKKLLMGMDARKEGYELEIRELRHLLMEAEQKLARYAAVDATLGRMGRSLPWRLTAPLWRGLRWLRDSVWRSLRRAIKRALDAVMRRLGR